MVPLVDFGNTVRPLGTRHLVRLKLTRSAVVRSSRKINCLQLQMAYRNPRLNLIGQGYFSFEERQPCRRAPEAGIL